MPANITDLLTYDHAGRRISQAYSDPGRNAGIASSGAELDEIGNPISETTLTPAIPVSITGTFTYDTRDRLTGVCMATPCLTPNDPHAISYSYDPVRQPNQHTPAPGSPE